MSDLVITEATLEDMDFFLSHAREEGWNPGLYDATPFFQTDPHGFFLGTFEEEKVGCISAVAYNDSFGFIGFYIVLPEFRKRGFGHQLWEHGLKYLVKRVIGLDGVLEQQKSYEQSGFRLQYNNHRFERKGGIGQHSTALVSLKEIPFDLLLNYDSPIFGLKRAVFLKHWINMPNAYSLGKVQEGKLLGYGVLRSCYEGHKVGPLFADSIDIAEEIFHSLCHNARDGAVFLDIPGVNTQALKIAENFNLKSKFETVRMYNNIPPNQRLDKIFGVTTFELG